MTMRSLINLIEAAADPKTTVRLYRGDSTDIQQFDRSKTDLLALFGSGIYLTNSPRVANDYKSKGASDDVLMRFGGMKSKDQVLQRWAEILAKQIDADGVDHSKSLMYFGGRAVPYSDGGDWNTITNDLRKAERAKRVEFAKAKIATILKTHEIRIKLDGEAVVQKKAAGGTAKTVAFDVPARMVARALDAEAEISDDVLRGIFQVLRRHSDSGTASEMMSWVQQQRREGEDPSFRQVFTAITGDSPIRSSRAIQDELIQEFEHLGYTGISYQGGLSMGGGHKHRAYVFWDADAINACRAKTGRPPKATS